MDSVEIQIGPCDYLNPGNGYAIKVTKNGTVILYTAKHPVTGKDLDLRSSVEVAGMYAPPVDPNPCVDSSCLNRT
jgi:hypothetical protein